MMIMMTIKLMKEARNNSVDTSTLMVFDEELIDGPSYLKEETSENDEKTSEEDEYEIKEFPTY